MTKAVSLFANHFIVGPDARQVVRSTGESGEETPSNLRAKMRK